MKIIVLRDKGSHLSVRFSRRRLAVAATAMATLCISAVIWVSLNIQPNEVDSQVVAQWRAKLDSQREAMQIIEQKSLAQSAAVGRQLAQMQARLLRMEAIGAHMAEAAELQDGEFDFSALPAQGGPVEGGQTALQFDDLAVELDRLSSAIKRREFELDVLDDVLVNEEIQTTSVVRGRPVKWGWLSSQFGQRVDPITGKTAWHSGVDFAGKDGSDVIAVASGVVTFAGKRSGYGKLVEISHANGYVTRYAHHKELTVETGEVVKKGESIGKMGSSGRSTGPHVHFEVLKNGRTVDPASYVTRRS
ncbi:MAG: M23 family metallopeptidase [Pseudomonadales bacterium]|jgi:murein DD-endopeptidase MepM/ murein hydrolase activator NlpD|nr:M23 family metallopeptidase [Pseudomonadales bacterium]